MASPKDPANTNRAHPVLRRADFSKNLRDDNDAPLRFSPDAAQLDAIGLQIDAINL